MLRSLKGKVLQHVLEHQIYHDLSSYSREEMAYVYLLMSIAGNHTSSNVAYGFNGAMQMLFPNAAQAIDALKGRGYLTVDLPIEFIMQDVNIPEIKEILKRHSLPVSGSRAVLLDRLLPALNCEDIVELKTTHSRWLPSAFGFEILYSFYHLWDDRLLNFAEALVSHDLKRISASQFSLFSLIPHRTGIGFSGEYLPIDPNEISFITSVVDAFVFIRMKYFKPEFYLAEL